MNYGVSIRSNDSSYLENWKESSLIKSCCWLFLSNATFFGLFFGRLGSLEFMDFVYLLKIFWDHFVNRLIKEEQMMLNINSFCLLNYKLQPKCACFVYRLFFLRLIAQFFTQIYMNCFVSWTNWVNSGKFMDNCWISCQVMADMKKVYNNLIIINLYDF